MKGIQKEVLPHYGLGHEEHDWTAVQWKMWFYGYLDPENERLATEVLAASKVRRTLFE